MMRTHKKQSIQKKSSRTATRRTPSGGYTHSNPEHIAHVIRHPEQASPNDVIHLQRLYGNQMTMQILQRSKVVEKPKEEEQDKTDDPIAGPVVDAPDAGESVDDDQPDEKETGMAFDALNKVEDNDEDVESEISAGTQAIQGQVKIAQDKHNTEQKKKQKKKSENPFVEFGKMTMKVGKDLKERSNQGYVSMVKSTGLTMGTGVNMEDNMGGLVKAGSDLNSVLTGNKDNLKDKNAVKSVGDAFGRVAGMTMFSNVFNIFAFVQKVYAFYMKRGHYLAYRELAEKNDTDKDTKTSSLRSTKLDNNAMVGAYGMRKTFRGMVSRIVSAVMSLGQVIARTITILSGLTLSLFSEAVDLSLAIASNTKRLWESTKGLWKLISNTKGKRRMEAAGHIVERAMGGDKDMLSLMIASEGLSKTWFEKMELSIGGEKQSKGLRMIGMGGKHTGGFNFKRKPESNEVRTLLSRPRDEVKLASYLSLLDDLGILKDAKKEVAETMKST